MALREIWCLQTHLLYFKQPYSEGGSYYQLVQSVLEANPCSFSESWHAMFHMDEVQNGNQLGVHQGRKCWLMNFAIEEFGPVILQREAAWLTLLVERTTKVQELHAGVCQVFATVMKSFCADPTWDMEAGLLLKGPPGGKNARILYETWAPITRWWAPTKQSSMQKKTHPQGCASCAVTVLQPSQS